ncbi:MAG TPA: hypothetical protein VK153_02290 [Candidatus Paceibacterota bacterium]|nr:hypothetical protein [Candidatus Paceibacterota bacterium]
MDKIKLNSRQFQFLVKEITSHLEDPSKIWNVIEKAINMEEEPLPVIARDLEYLEKIKNEKSLQKLEDMFYNNLDKGLDKAIARRAIEICQTKEEIIHVYRVIIVNITKRRDMGLENLLTIRKMAELA